MRVTQLASRVIDNYPAGARGNCQYHRLAPQAQSQRTIAQSQTPARPVPEPTPMKLLDEVRQAIVVHHFATRALSRAVNPFWRVSARWREFEGVTTGVRPQPIGLHSDP